MSFKDTEPHVLKWLREGLGRGDVALDVGANVGFMTLVMSRSVGRSGKVFAFEPSTANLALLRYHCDKNRLANVRIMSEAVCGAHRQSAPFYLLQGGDSSSNSLMFGRAHVPNLDRELHSSQQKIIVETVTIDGFCEERSINPRVIKIDVEGAEYDVIEGMRNTLHASRPIVILAVHPWWLPQGKTTDGIIAMMREHRYEIVDARGLPTETLGYGEYLCSPM
jgi:FkbM family methyltransferase